MNGEKSMGFAELLLLGVALAADAFAVTLANSVTYAGERGSRLALMPVFFGVFQALMPLLGYAASGLAASFIERYSGIVAFVILAIIGGKMVFEGASALREAAQQRKAAGDAQAEGASGVDEGQPGEKGEPTRQRLTLMTLFVQAIATAIDAFAVGIGFRALTVSIVPAVTIIGVTTAALCVVALLIGRKLGELLGDRAEIAGGIVLVLIGLKALLG